MRKQIYLDCNGDEASEIAPGIFLAPSKILPGARIIDKMDSFFRVVVLMGKAYIMADESILGGCEELFKDSKPEWFFNFDNLRRIDYILHEYGREIVNTHIYNLPASGSEMEEPYGDEIWLDEKRAQRQTVEQRLPRGVHNELRAGLCGKLCHVHIGKRRIFLQVSAQNKRIRRRERGELFRELFKIRRQNGRAGGVERRLRAVVDLDVDARHAAA